MHSSIEAQPSPRELCLPLFTVLAQLQHPPVLNAQDSPFRYLLDLTDVGGAPGTPCLLCQMKGRAAGLGWPI